MLNKILLIASLFLIIGCGGGGSSPAQKVTPDNPDWPTHYAATASDLPSCNSDRQGQLWYVEDADQFQACKTSGWAVIDIRGQEVVSVETLAESATNICTQFTNDSCYFHGGQKVVYSDESVFITGTFYIITFFIDTDGDLSFDTDMHTATLVVGPDDNTGFAMLSRLVARGDGAKRLFIAYDKASDLIKLVHDTDGDLAWSAGDTDVETVVVEP